MEAVGSDRLGKATGKVKAMNNLEPEDLEAAANTADQIYAGLEGTANNNDSWIAIAFYYEVGRVLARMARKNIASDHAQAATCMQLLAALNAGMEKESDVR
jgi:hypothetical protein